MPVAAASLPSGKVLLWSAYDPYAFSLDLNTQTVWAVFDPATNTTTSDVVSLGHEMFCPGTALLPDGRVFVNGGSIAAATSIYNPNTNSWARVQDMNIPRGYNGTVTLPNGNVFTLGGSWSGGEGNKNAEVWNANSGWRALPDAPVDPVIEVEPAYRSDNHAWLFPMSGDRVFYAGPGSQMQWYSSSGTGSVTYAGQRGDDQYSMNGTVAMFEPGKILKMGGAIKYTDDGEANNRVYVIDINADVNVRRVQNMRYARTYADNVILPTGEVMVVGGQARARGFSDDNSVLTPEIWNPQTETWRTVAPHFTPRNYHSVALLLPDGRVLSGGGGLCGTCPTNHPNIELFSPGYLFNADGSLADRPTILTAPSSTRYGNTFSVTTDAEIERFHLVRLASTTHALNTDQRFLSLEFTRAGNAYTINAPSDSNIALPGYYMLFALDPQGVPSVAKTVRLY